MSSPSAHSQILTGLRVIDWTEGSADTRATSLLADYGADVVWIEQPAVSSTPVTNPVHRAVFGRNKRSVLLDPSTDEGAAQLRELVATADVLVHGRDEAEVSRLGLDFDTLGEANPALVYCSLSGFGPAAKPDLPGYESLVHASVGTMAEQPGYREAPIYEGLPFAGIGMGYLAQLGILAALYRRGHDGRGGRVETSMLDGALSFLSMMWGHADSDDVGSLMAPGTQRLLARTFLCADDEYIGVHTGASGAFGRVIEVLGLEDRIPPTSDGADIGVALTADQQRILQEEVPGIFLRDPRQTWLRRLLEADICAIPVFRPTECFDEPQVRHNRMVVRVDDPVLGEIDEVSAPLRFGTGDVDTPAPIPAPVAGSTSAPQALADRPLERVATPGRNSRSGDGPGRTDAPLLAGLKVLDFGVWYASSYSSRMLADLGADVIRVEPLGGDQMRGMRRPFQSAHSRTRNFSTDLKHPEMAEVTQRLMAWADVIHHNMRPGAAERLGIGFEQARAVNPDIV